MMKKFLLYTVILSLLAGAFVAPLAKEKVILKVWEYPDPMRTDQFAKADRAVIDAFLKKYPYIELRPFSGITIEGMSLDSQILMAIAGGVAPDIMYVNFRMSDTYVRNGFLYPMDEFISKVSSDALNLRVAKPVWPVIKRAGNDGKTHTWALPYSTYIRALAYRKDLFAKVGLDPEHAPRDWDELLKYVRRLTIPEQGTYGMLLSSGPNAAWDWITYLWSAGGRAVKQQEDGSWRAVYNSEAGVDAMEYYIKLITTKWRDASGRNQEGFVIREGSNRYQLWEQGKVGMYMVYLDDKYLGKNLDPNLCGIAPVPYSPAGIRGAELNCPAMGIFAEAGISNNTGLGDRDPVAVRDAAWKYIWFNDSEEARKIRIKVMVEGGYGKMQNPVYLKRYGYEEYLKHTNPEWIRAFEDALKDGIPEPYGKNCQMVYTYMTLPLEKCISLDREGKLGKTREERRAKIKELLDKAVKRTNEEMIGVLPEGERAKRNHVAAVVATIVMAIFFFVLWRVWLIFTPKDGPRVQGWMLGKYFYAYLLLVPAISLILFWKYIPMIMGSVMSFQDYKAVGESTWIGFQNFATVLYDPVWWAALGKTLYYMFLYIMLAFWPPIILAILLQEVSHGKIIYRVIYYLPAVVTGVIVIYLWKLMFDPSDTGALNQLLLFFGLDKMRWIDDEKLAMLCVVIPTAWAMLGPACLIYLAALKGIPNDNYESADIDGANFFQKVYHIVFPNLKALVLIQLINAFIMASQQSDFILVMTFGGPNEATKVAGLMIFEKAYMFLKFGVATTMAWMLAVLLLGFTVIQLRKLSNMEFRAGGSDS